MLVCSFSGVFVVLSDAKYLLLCSLSVLIVCFLGCSVAFVLCVCVFWFGLGVRCFGYAFACCSFPP